MTEHERYKQVFAALDTGVTPDQVRAAAEAGKGEKTMKHRRALRLVLIAAAVLILLVGSVAAAGISQGWLLPALSNAGVDSALLDKVMHPAVSTVVGDERWTVDELLVEGNHVFLQYTRESLDGSPIPDHPEGGDWVLFLMDKDGIRMNDAQGSTGYLTDDTGDPARRVELMCFDLWLEGQEPDWENTSLLVYLDKDWIGRTRLRKLMYSAPVGEPLYRKAVLEDGRPVQIGRFSLELDPTGLAEALTPETVFSVLLSDGTEIRGGISEGVASPELGLVPGKPVSIVFRQILDPDSVVALKIGAATYPLADGQP